MDGEYSGPLGAVDRKLRHWDELYRTDPKHTKGFTRSGGFKGTAIKPIWNQYRLTEHFGPAGIGWGFERPAYEVVKAEDELLVFCTLKCWYMDDNGERAEIYGVGGDKVLAKQQRGLVSDDEAFKKALTDAIGNAFVRVGLSADVHMGLFEDSKYVVETRRHFAQADEPRDATPTETRTEAATAQGSPGRATTTTHRSPQAAPAPSEASTAAKGRIKELAALIDEAKTVADLTGIEGCPAWQTCRQMIVDAAGEDAAVNSMALLVDRIEGQRQFLLGGA